ncbi:cytochrome P450 [Angustibacter sp. McL0619]|uniref:cytochrome P450 n=1 Tax=Angustibacter sp. McL0619 TaxID=3415676 RepID=UPI003CEA4D69
MAGLFTPEGREDPYPYYRALHERGPVLQLAPGAFIAIGFHEVNKLIRDANFLVEEAAYQDRVSLDWRAHSSLLAVKNSLLFTNSPDHERVRGMVNGPFSARRILELQPRIAHLAEAQLDLMLRSAAGDGVVDFSAEFALPYPLTILSELLGLPVADCGWLRPRVGELTAVLDPQAGRRDLKTADDAASELMAYLAELIENRHREPQGDLISQAVLSRHATDCRLGRDELIGNLIALMLATESTGNLLSNGVAVLLERPELWTRLHEQPELVDDFITEAMRYDLPVQLTSRRAHCDSVVAGTEITAGCAVLIGLGAANRDPRRFAKPDVFDLQRHDNRPITYGGGSHFCLGAALAAAEVKAAFASLFARFATIGKAGVPIRRDRSTIRGYGSLPVVFSTP